MDTLAIKYAVLNKALASMDEALEYFKAVQDSRHQKITMASYETVYRASRDSVVQRFEYTIELFWKYLRLFLEEGKQIQIPANTPRDVIRTASQARIISEADAEVCMDMIKSRNLTSHIYKEDIAEQLMRDIPGYYQKMKTLAKTIRPE